LTRSSAARAKPVTIRILWALTILLAAVGVAAVTRRAVSLFAASPAPPRFPEEATFARHPLLTMVHIFPGLLFMVLGPLQFVRSLRSRRPKLHRWTGRVFVGAGLIIGGTALVMSPQMAIGGATETASTMFFAIVFLLALMKGFLSIRQGKVALHREWMIRAFAIGLAVATVRPIVGMFFATRGITKLTPHDFFGLAFWLGFTIHVIAAEIWIRRWR
jgi:uncharacterized membrane protein